MFLPRPNRPARFALVADDFGLTDGVSRSIVALVAAGRLSGTGVMTNRPWAATFAGELLAAAGDRAEIGLHLNLTLARPLTRMERLAPWDRLPAFGTLARLALRGGLSAGTARREIEAEIDAQLEAFGEAYGRWPDYVDGHQHVHVLPGVRGALLAAIARRPGWRPWVRDSGDSIGAILARGVSVPKALVIAALSIGMGRAAARAGLGTNHGFSGVSPFDPVRPYAADFARFLLAPGPRHLVMCHPGHVDDALAALDPVVETREQEHAFLAGPGFEAALAEAALGLARLSDL